MEFFGQHKELFTLLHLAAVAVGVGGATITDIFFFRFLRNLRISNGEAKTLRVLSGIIWIAIIFVILSGVALYASDPARYNQAPKFLAKMVIVCVILANGLLLNLYISPRLSEIKFEKETHRELRRFRKIAFASGAISLTSWYAALVLGALRNLSVDLAMILGVYLALLTGAIIFSQITESRYAKQAERWSRL